MAAPRKAIRVALDWTPNTIHTGLFLAQAKGYYAARGLHVELVSPDETYSKTPAKQLHDGQVQLAVCPSESCISYNQSGQMKLQAIYAVLQEDASAIVSTSLAKIAELGNGKTYGSYNARFEDRIVQAMIEHDGGNPDGVQFARREAKLTLFEALKSDRVDATWVFMPWEGLEAEVNSIKLEAFRPSDYGIPYGYSPVIAYDAGSDALSKDELWRFVAATIEGYDHAIRNIEDSVEEMSKHCMPARSQEFLRQSQSQINRFYGSGATLGRMSNARWTEWLRWLEKQGFLKEGEMVANAMYTNP